MTQPKFLDPELMRRMQALELRAREVAEGVLMGVHHARNRGRSIEFAEHKEYTPGDDIRRIDWKVYAKSDRYYIKEYEDDTNISSLILVDGSRSMAYGGEDAKDEDGNPVPSKLDRARLLACAVSYLLLNQSDAVGMGIVGDGLSDFLPPRPRQTHFHEITKRLAGIEPKPGTDIARSLADLVPLIKGRAMVIIFSDLLDEPDTMLHALRLLRSRRQEIVVFHVLDRDEIDFPFQRLSMFKDMEGPVRLTVDPRTIREEYQKHMNDFIDRVRRECDGRGIDYNLARTDRSPSKLLTSWLGYRQAVSASGARRTR